MLGNIIKTLTFVVIVLTTTAVILFGLSSTTGLMPAPQAISAKAKQDSKLVFGTYNSIQKADVLDMKQFTPAPPSDIIQLTASRDSLQAYTTNGYEWSPRIWPTFTTTKVALSSFLYPAQITVAYAWLGAFVLVALLVGIVLRPLFWKPTELPTACACGLIAPATKAKTQPHTRAAEIETLGAITGFPDHSSDIVDTDSEYDDDDNFIDDDSGSEYEDDGVSEDDPQSEYASDIVSDSDGSEHGEALVPAVVMVRPYCGFRPVRSIVRELERRANNV